MTFEWRLSLRRPWTTRGYAPLSPSWSARLTNSLTGTSLTPWGIESSTHCTRSSTRSWSATPTWDSCTPWEVQGIRAEWSTRNGPRTRPRPQKNNRRGNFDLAVLSPAQLKQVVDVEQFTQGRIEAPIVVELGLGYGGVHLAGDDEKLVNSQVQHAFLVHFSHVRSKLHQSTETVISTAATRMQVAYVLHDLDTRQFRVKRRADDHISGPHDATR